jgi:hypothetical protein
VGAKAAEGSPGAFFLQNDEHASYRVGCNGMRHAANARGGKNKCCKHGPGTKVHGLVLVKRHSGARLAWRAVARFSLVVLRPRLSTGLPFRGPRGPFLGSTQA